MTRELDTDEAVALAGDAVEMAEASEAIAPAWPTGMDAVHRYTTLIRRKRELEVELNQVRDALGETEESGPGELEKRVLEHLSEQGIQSMRVDGFTVYLHHTLWAGAADGDWDRACAALRAAGLGQFVAERFNIMTLSSWVRERAAASEPLPEPFEGAIAVREVFRARARKAR